MRARITRAAVRIAACLSLLAASACITLTEAERTELALVLENAANYYDAGHYPRAFQQWGRALTLDSGNEKARLGQAFAMLQMGQEATPESMRSLGEAERRFALLLEDRIGDQQWKVDLGYGLVQEKWAEHYDRHARLLEAREEAGEELDDVVLADVRAERAQRIVAAESAFRRVLAGDEREPRDRLTCTLALAKLAWYRGDLEESLLKAQEYEKSVMASKRLWEEQIKTAPPAGRALFEAKLLGAERQEAELRDLLGAVLFKLGRTQEAARELDQVIALDPARASAYLNRGLLWEGVGNWDRAAGDYRTFLRLTRLPENDPAVHEANRRMLRCQAELDREDAGRPRR